MEQQLRLQAARERLKFNTLMEYEKTVLKTERLDAFPFFFFYFSVIPFVIIRCVYSIPLFELLLRYFHSDILIVIMETGMSDYLKKAGRNFGLYIRRRGL